MSEHQAFRSELAAERRLSVEEVWQAAESRLDWPVSKGMNTAHEACDRWARDRSRVAMIVVHPGGRREVWTYAELSRASNQLATAWQEAGLRREPRCGRHWAGTPTRASWTSSTSCRRRKPARSGETCCAGRGSRAGGPVRATARGPRGTPISDAVWRRGDRERAYGVAPGVSFTRRPPIVHSET
jgi:hypothetical protein